MNRSLLKSLSLLVVLATVPLVFGCDDQGSGERVIQRDSLGVFITETVMPRWEDGSPWQIGETPLLDLTVTGIGSAHEFHRVTDATRLRNGSIAVTDEGSRQVRLFSGTGEFVGAVGGAGEGPGEFARLASVHELSDGSVIAFDFWLGRITRWSGDLELVETLRPYDLNTRVEEIHLLEDDTLVGVTWSREVLSRVVGRYRMPYTIVRFELDGLRADTLATLQGFEGYAFEQGDARPLFRRSGHVAVHNGRLYVGEADSLEIRVHELDGKLARVMRVPGFDLSLSRDEVRAERESLLWEGAPEYFRNLVRNMEDPETKAAYAGLLVDSEGFVWAPEARGIAESGPVAARIFSPEGEWLGNVTLPDRFRVFEIGTDYLLGVGLDELDVERLQVWALDRRDMQ